MASSGGDLGVQVYFPGVAFIECGQRLVADWGVRWRGHVLGFERNILAHAGAKPVAKRWLGFIGEQMAHPEHTFGVGQEVELCPDTRPFWRRGGEHGPHKAVEIHL